MAKFLSNALFKGTLTAEGAVTLSTLTGSGSRMVVANALGILSTAVIPTEVDTLATVTARGNVTTGDIAIKGKLTIGSQFAGSSQRIEADPGAGNFDFINSAGGGFYYRWMQNGGTAMQLTTANNLIVYNKIYSEGPERVAVLDAPNSIIGFAYLGGNGGPYGLPMSAYMHTDGSNSLFFSTSGLTKALTIAGAGNLTVSTLAGTGTRMMVADATGLVSTQAIPTASLQGAVDADKNTSASLAVGTTTVKSVSASTYSGVFFDYVVKNGTNVRVGSVVAITNGTAVEFYETLSNDIGTTTGLTFTVTLASGSIKLNAVAAATGWTVIVSTRAI